MKAGTGKKALLPAFALAAALGAAGCGGSVRGNADYTDILNNVRNGNIRSVTIEDRIITAQQSTNVFGNSAGKSLQAVVPPNTDAAKALLEANPAVKISSTMRDTSYDSLLYTFLPIAAMVGVWWYFSKKMSGGGAGGMASFGKSRAKLSAGNDSKKVTFKDVAGADEAKTDLQEIVEFLKEPQKFQRLGGRIPKGVMLYGEPGTGKTLLARAVAGEANVPFYSISGSDFVEMFVGVGASRVRDLFEQGKKNAPCIVFIDEIDAVGKRRGSTGPSSSHSEQEQTLNQLLAEMDGFEPNSGVILVAATNRLDVLDPALLRAGRFDRKIPVNNPDLKAREAILGIHTKKIKVDPAVDLKRVARATPGMSGADLANLVNEAALFAGRRNHQTVTAQDYEDAREKIQMGAENRSLTMTDAQKEKTAYHEAGHTLLAYLLRDRGAEPIHKVTIVPRGGALGFLLQLPEGDRVSLDRQQLKSRLTVAAGGRAAEHLIYGEDHVTTGAQGDIAQINEIAENMVTKWGLSNGNKLGLRSYGENERLPAWFGAQAQGNRSERSAEKVDAAIDEIVNEAEEGASALLNSNEEALHRLVKALVTYETLDGDQVAAVIEDRFTPPAAEPPSAPPPTPPSAPGPS